MRRWKIRALLTGAATAAIRGAVAMKCLLFAALSGAIATLFGGKRVVVRELPAYGL